MVKTLTHTFGALLGVLSAATVIILMAVVVVTVVSSGTMGSSAGSGQVDPDSQSAQTGLSGGLELRVPEPARSEEKPK